jgi:CheY-like chemotaxis protein
MRPGAVVEAKPSFLLVDADRGSLEALRFGFTREGCESFGADNAAEALALASLRNPRVAVLAQEPNLDALAMLPELAGLGEGAPQAVLILGPKTGREEALAAGAALHLAKPVFLKDVISLARLLAEPTEIANGVRIIRTQLGTLPLYALTRALLAARRQAVLACSRGRRTGQVAVAGGSIMAADVGTLAGAAAFEHLILWSQGELEVRLGAVVGHRTILAGAGELIENASRTMREFQEDSAPLGGVEAVYEQVIQRASEEIARIPREVTPLLRLCDGTRTLVDLVADSPFRRGDTLRIVGRLLELQLIYRRDGLRPQGARNPARDDQALAAAPDQASLESASSVADSPVAVPPAVVDTWDTRDTRDTPDAGDTQALGQSEERAPVAARSPAPALARLGRKTSSRIKSRRRSAVTPAVAVPEAAPDSRPIQSGVVDAGAEMARQPGGLLSGETRAPLQETMDQQMAAGAVADGPVAPAPPPRRGVVHPNELKELASRLPGVSPAIGVAHAPGRPAVSAPMTHAVASSTRPSQPIVPPTPAPVAPTDSTASRSPEATPSGSGERRRRLLRPPKR